MVSFCAQGAAPDKARIAQVQSGKLKTANAAWWGFDKKDSTKALRAALASKAGTIIVPNMKADWIVDPIKVPSNKKIIFKNGVVVRAKKGSFKGRKDSLFDIDKQKNVVLKGEGKVTFIMNKKDYANPALYTHAEWRHTINIYNSNNVEVDNLTLLSSGGDGVYVGSMNCQNVRLTNLICDDHYRQGFSITGVKNLYVKNCKFLNTGGTAPQAGLDLEPNYKGGVGLQNIVFENCEFSGNRMAGIYLSNNSHVATTVTFRNCLIKNNLAGGIGLGPTAKGQPKAPGKVEFINCRIEGHKVSSVSMGLHTVKTLKIIFRKCVIDNRQSAHNAMVLSSDSNLDLHGVEITDLTVIDDKKRAPIVFNSRYANALINPIIKNVVVKNSKGQITKFDCAKFIKDSAPNKEAKAFKVLPPDRRELLPISSRGEKPASLMKFRDSFDFYLYARSGQKIPITFTNHPTHNFKVKPVDLIISTPTINNVERKIIPHRNKLTYTLHAKETGVYNFQVRVRSLYQTISVECAAPGQAFSCSEKLYLLGCSGILYFAVPAGVKKVVLEAGGVHREESSVYLLGPDGKVAAQKLRMAGSHLLNVVRKNPKKSEIWGIRFNAAKLFLRLGDPIPQIFAASPMNLLVRKGTQKTYRPIPASFFSERDAVRNGNFRILTKTEKRYKISTPQFPRNWGGHSAALVTTPDHRNHIDFTNVLWSYLSLPSAAGKFKGEITLSGTGEVTAYLRTTVGKGPFKTRKPLFGPFVLTAAPKTFTFTFDKVEKENGYIYIQANGKLKTKARISELKITPILNK